MEKYNSDTEAEAKAISRTSRNKRLYDEIKNTELTRFNSFNNARVIDEGAKEIDLNKIKKYIEKINDEKVEKRRSLLDTKGLYEERHLEEEEEKDYDLVSVLEKAREKREIDYEKERYKKLRDTQYDILKNLNIKERPKPEIDEEKFNTQERTLIDLINTVAINKNNNDLLSELSEGDDETTGSIDEESNNEDLKALIKEEIDKDKTKEVPKENEDENIQNLDNSFYTSSLNFSKDDFEDFNDVEESGGRGIAAKIGIILLILCILGVLLLIANFIFDLNII